MTRTYVLLDYCGGAKRLYAGNDQARVRHVVEGYKRAGWTGEDRPRVIRAASFTEATEKLWELVKDRYEEAT